jgi:hypothetical protein
MSEVMKDELLSGTYDRLLNERPRRLASWHRFLDDAAAKGRAVLDGMAQ